MNVMTNSRDNKLIPEKKAVNQSSVECKKKHDVQKKIVLNMMQQETTTRKKIT